MRSEAIVDSSVARRSELTHVEPSSMPSVEG